MRSSSCLTTLLLFPPCCIRSSSGDVGNTAPRNRINEIKHPPQRLKYIFPIAFAGPLAEVRKITPKKYKIVARPVKDVSHSLFILSKILKITAKPDITTPTMPTPSP